MTPLKAQASLRTLWFGEFLRELGLRGLSGFHFNLHYSVVNPVLEELLWRSYLWSRSRKIVPTGLWFAGYHGLVLVKLVAIPMVASVSLTSQSCLGCGVKLLGKPEGFWCQRSRTPLLTSASSLRPPSSYESEPTG